MPFLIPFVAVASVGGLFFLNSIVEEMKVWAIALTIIACLWFAAKGLGWM